MLRTRLRSVLSLSVLVAAVASLAGQESPARAVDDQLGRIFDANEYAVPRFGPARWRPDGVSYAMVEPSGAAGGGSDIVRYDAATGARDVLVGGIKLVAAGQTAPLPIDNYAWSADGTRLLIFTNTKKVWRDHTRGDYWVIDQLSLVTFNLTAHLPEELHTER